MRPPVSASEKRMCSAEKIGSTRYSDFFNRIDPTVTSEPITAGSSVGAKGPAACYSPIHPGNVGQIVVTAVRSGLRP